MKTTAIGHVFNALAPLAVALALVAASAGAAYAQLPTKLVVTVSDNVDPAPSGAPVTYAVVVKNDGTFQAHNVVVTIPVPTNTEFVRCTYNGSVPCIVTDGIVTAALGVIKAHLERRVSLTLTMPTVSTSTQVTVEADADSTDATDDRNSATTTVLAAETFLTYLPSGRTEPIACGDTLSSDMFGSDTTAKLGTTKVGGTGLGCTAEQPYGLKITAGWKTLDLNGLKIVGVPALGNIGILVSNAVGVTIIGGSRGGTSGIELFDWCVKDEGKSVKLTITNLRCFGARTAGIDITSKMASIIDVTVDKVVGTANNTYGPPGGVGIRTRRDAALIKDSIVKRSGTVGIWVGGTDLDGNGRVASIVGSNIASSTSKMRTENGTGIGLLLDGGPHFVKDVYIDGVYNDRDDPPVEGKNGVVVGLTGVNNLLDGVVVKQHGGHAFVVDGTGTTITNSNVDGIGLDGFVVTGAGSTLSGNGVQNARHGFIVTATGLDTDLDTNETEGLDGDGFVVDGDTPILTGNTAQGNLGRGFVIGGDSGLLDTNTAEANEADGFIVTGSGHTLKTNNSKSNGGTGYTVSGSQNHLKSNGAELNTSFEWVIGPNNVDGGSNTRGSSFPAISFTSAAYTSPN
jgi:uncharacterized repeat protein (TIGR01451 family)